MKTFILKKFWRDPDIEKLDKDGKLAVLWILTNESLSPLGFCETTPERFSFETKLAPGKLQETIKSLPRMLITGLNFVFIRNYIKYQCGFGRKLIANNYFVRLQSEIDSLQPEQQQVISEFYPEFNYKGLPRAYQGLVKSVEALPPPLQNPHICIGREGKGGVGGEDDDLPQPDVELPAHFPRTEQDAKSHAAFVGCTEDFASNCWKQAMARGGKDSRGRWIVSWRHHLSISDSYRKSNEEEKRNHETNKPNNRQSPNRNTGTFNEGQGKAYADFVKRKQKAVSGIPDVLGEGTGNNGGGSGSVHSGNVGTPKP